MSKNVKHGKRLYKQMALEVAVRNPERYLGILTTFSKFEGRKLDDTGILDIYVQLFLDGVIESEKLTDEQYTPEYLRQFIVSKLSHNNEWGFPTGYQAAFTRYLKTLSEFGFLYAQYNQPLHVSPVGKAMVENRITLSEAFALQSMRFWRKSPYRRVLNDFNFFSFVLNAIRKREECGRKLSYIQFLVSLFSDNGDVNAFLDLIDNNLIGSDLDKAYALVCERYSEIDDDHAKVVKLESAFRDYGNTVFRVLQLTGFITVDYSGVMLLTLNKNRSDFLQALLDRSFMITEEAKEDEELYFQEIGSFPEELEKLVCNYREKQDLSTCEYNKKIPDLLSAYKFTKESLAAYLLEVANNKQDKRAFWYLQAPVKFELLITLFLYTCYGNAFEYKPNYKCDDAGIPYSHAPGNIGDIELTNETVYWLIEATLIRNKNQQVNSETVNLFRHINGAVSVDSYMSLVAPAIHEDTALIIQVGTILTMLEHKKNRLSSKAYDITSFVECAGECSCLDNMKEYTITYIRQLRDFINALDV